MTNKNFLYGDSDYLCSLNAFVNKKVVDVIGYPSDPFGGTPVFVISQLLFEDGTTIYVEGEHDTAYLSSNSEFTNMDEETLQDNI
jgi:hypothetical protein